MTEEYHRYVILEEADNEDRVIFCVFDEVAEVEMTDWTTSRVTVREWLDEIRNDLETGPDFESSPDPGWMNE